jgi:hypothetical protein
VLGVWARESAQRRWHAPWYLWRELVNISCYIHPFDMKISSSFLLMLSVRGVSRYRVSPLSCSGRYLPLLSDNKIPSNFRQPWPADNTPTIMSIWMSRKVSYSWQTSELNVTSMQTRMIARDPKEDHRRWKVRWLSF